MHESDPTGKVRRLMLETGGPQAGAAATHRKWTTDELRLEFEVHGFLAPFVQVTRKADGARGTMMFTHHPRWYFDFQKDEPA